MKKIYSLFAATVLSVMLLSGCIEETFPMSDTVTASQVAASEASLNGLLLAIPSQMTNYHTILGDYAYDFCYPGLLIAYDSMGGDIVSTGANDNNWFTYWMGGLYMGTEYGLTDLTWHNYYAWIKSCDDVITICKSVSEEEMNSSMRYALGVALTYRAFYYLDLVRLFEPKECTDPQIHDYVIPDDIKGLSCVIVTEETSEEATRYNPRAKVEDVYDLIFSDLTEATKYLEDYTPSSKQMPNLAIVYGMLARAYLERGTAGVDGAYAKAAEYARLAINTGGYTPLTQAQWEDPTTGFNDAYSNNSWMWCLSISSTNVSNLASFMSHMSNESLWTIYGCSVGRGINSTLYDMIPDDDFRKHSWLDPDLFNYYDYQSCLPSGEFTFRTHTYDGYKDFFSSYLYPYASIKFRPGGGDYTNYKVGNVVDIPLMRIEEMYLIEAEALAAAGNLSEGKTKLEEFMHNYRSPSYSCSANSIRDFQEEVATQVRIEFWGEGVSFWYKKRLGLGIHLEDAVSCITDEFRFECDGIIPWWNLVISLNEFQTNLAVQGHNNPEPSGTLDPIIK